MISENVEGFAIGYLKLFYVGDVLCFPDFLDLDYR